MNQLLLASTPSGLLILQPFPSLEPLRAPLAQLEFSACQLAWNFHVAAAPGHQMVSGQSVQVGSKLQGPPAVAALLPGFFCCYPIRQSLSDYLRPLGPHCPLTHHWLTGVLPTYSEIFRQSARESSLLTGHTRFI